MNVIKGGWHPGGSKSGSTSSSTGSGSKSITGLGVRGKLSEAKGRATGKPVGEYTDRDTALAHQSRPLSSLKDPASFAPPPKHSAYYGPGATAGSSSSSTAVATRPAAPAGGWGAPAVESGYAERKRAEQREREEQEQMEAEAERERRRAEGYKRDTSGLRTDHLPPPPVRKVTTDDQSPALPGRRQSPALPGRNGSPAVPPGRTQSPALPPRQPPRSNVAPPPPSLPPRQNEYPDEHTPAPPPAYQEALKQPAVHQAASQAYQQNSGTINQFAAQRLGQAGVSVPGFGIGGSNGSTPQPAEPARGHGQQLGELQQRFARMGTGSSSSTPPPVSSATAPAASNPAANKKPPPPPPKKAGLSVGGANSAAPASPAPPPLPLGSKPRPPM